VARDVLTILRPTVIVGLFLQQVIALFVLKSGAGFSIFKWIATLASDFLAQAIVGAEFFFDADTVAKHWFFVNTVRVHPAIIQRFDSNMNSAARLDYFLYCVHPNDVLSRCYAMGH
jgi:nucleoside permease NupC